VLDSLRRKARRTKGRESWGQPGRRVEGRGLSAWLLGTAWGLRPALARRTHAGGVAARPMKSAREAVLRRDGEPDRRGNRGVQALQVARACARPGLIVALALACAFLAPAAASRLAEDGGGRLRADADACAEGDGGHKHTCPGQMQCVGAICGDTRSGCAADEDGEHPKPCSD